MDRGSIRRTIDADEWMIYSFYENRVSFTLVNESITTALVLKFPLAEDGFYVVNDFEILNDSVYFCGYKENWQGLKTAIFGYFALAGFPTTNVYYYAVAGFSNFDKMDLYDDEGHPHVVMIGDALHQAQVIVDTREVGLNHWIFDIADYSYQSELLDIRFDDVAVTDDYVFVTSRGLYDGIVYIQEFAKPASYSSIFIGNIAVFPISLYNASPVLIEHCYDNYYSILTSIDDNKIIVGFYNEYGCLSQYETTRDYFHCRDLKVNSICPETVDVLLKISDINGNVWSEIITSVSMQTPGNKPIVISVHKYPDHDIYSMDFVAPQDNIIASGQPEQGGELYVYRCYRNEWNCEEEESTFFVKSFNPTVPWPFEIVTMIVDLYANQIKCGEEVVNVQTKCKQQER